MEVGIILVFALVFLLSYYFIIRTKKNFPPGPLNVPYIGCVQLMMRIQRTRPHLALHDMSQKYGPVCSFRYGNRLMVVLSGYDAIHEALVKRADEFSDRPSGVAALALTKDGAGVILNNYNHNWKVLRRFTLRALRDFGVGKSSLEEKISTEIDAAAKLFVEQGDQPVDISTSTQMMIGNIVYGIVFGVRYDYGDPDFSKVKLLTSAVLTGNGVLNLSGIFPDFILKMFMKFSRQITFKERRSRFARCNEFVEKNVAAHEATFDENNIRDFVDLYIKTTRENDNVDKTEFTKGGLQRVINDLFLAGSETTSNSLDWAFLYMSEYPDVQKKCQDEIEEVMGGKYITYSDRETLPYLNATLQEIQRISVIVPLSVSHSNGADAVLRGYTIPAKSIILPNLYSACMDPKYWDQPETFRPERFLDQGGKLKKTDAFIPFSTGPRQCLGEPLAKMEMFLIFANMLQRFTFRRENEAVKHSLKCKDFQATNTPERFRLRVKSRSH